MKKNKKAGIIYTAECKVTGEFYVGATTGTVEQRRLDHLKRAQRGEQSKFIEAISTYGPEAFVWKQTDTANTTDELALKEKQHITKYNAIESGFNSDAGGGFKKTIYQYSPVDGRLIKSYKDLQSAANAVNVSKKSIGSACLGQIKTCKGFYWSYTLTVPYLISSDLRKRKVVQMSLAGQKIAEYESVADASRISGVSKTCISRVCRGEREQSRGFMWRYI